MDRSDQKWEKIESEFFEDNSEESEFGFCEECGCELSYRPSGAWGVGYVCIECAKKLRGEYE